jgi:hypothetical protein
MLKRNESKFNSSRRRFVVSTGGAVSVAALASMLSRTAQAADLPHLAVTDPTATAFNYIEDAKASKHAKYVAGSDCSNCDFYQARGTKAPFGPCLIYPGKAVNALGWCSNYVKVR